MILVDSSVWIDHLRSANSTLADLLANGEVLSHPVVIGELALGHIKREDMIINKMSELPAAEIVEHHEALAFIRLNALGGSGIGYGDAHLLASARLTPDASLWTRDRSLLSAALRLGVAADLDPFFGFHEE